MPGRDNEYHAHEDVLRKLFSEGLVLRHATG
jgi:hypothetical protein